ncbi:MAG: hypothetical protein U0930_11075 [Pirellulales bacterium]
MQLDYDPEIDTPATIAIIGGGSTGIEAATYARFLGYSVELYDAAKVGDSLVQWGDRPMHGSWQQLTSSLGLAAIEAHEHPLPDPQATPTYREYVDQYLLPLARTDLLYSSITVHASVLSVCRLGCNPADELTTEQRADQEFRLLATSEQRGQFTQVVDLVLDCSGSQSVRTGMASGGGEPIGWSQMGDRVRIGRRRVLTREKELYSQKKVLLWGNDIAAAANALDLNQLVKSSGTQLFWCVPKRLTSRSTLIRQNCEPSPLSDEEIAAAEAIFREADGLNVVPLEAWGIEGLRDEAGKLVVTLQKTEDETLDFSVDEIIHCGALASELNYKHNLSLDLREGSAFVTCEPHYYRLGVARTASQLHPFEQIREQIQQAFGMIGGRAELNLYQTVRPQRP